MWLATASQSPQRTYGVDRRVISARFCLVGLAAAAPWRGSTCARWLCFGCTIPSRTASRSIPARQSCTAPFARWGDQAQRDGAPGGKASAVGPTTARVHTRVNCDEPCRTSHRAAAAAPSARIHAHISANGSARMPAALRSANGTKADGRCCRTVRQCSFEAFGFAMLCHACSLSGSSFPFAPAPHRR